MVTKTSLTDIERIIEQQNTALDDFDALGFDVMSEGFLEASPEELANRMIQKQKEIKDEKQKLREAAKIKAAIEARGRLLNEHEAYRRYSELMIDFPSFDDAGSGNHWSSNLVRVMHEINYKHSVDTLANPHKVLGDIEAISCVAIVKSHLSVATFDHIATQMSDYLISNPGFNIADAVSIKTAASYTSDTAHKLDEKSESSAQPEWGSW